MIERIVIIDNVDPVSFYGVNNCNMQLIRNLFQKIQEKITPLKWEDTDNEGIENEIEQYTPSH